MRPQLLGNDGILDLKVTGWGSDKMFGHRRFGLGHVFWVFFMLRWLGTSLFGSRRGCRFGAGDSYDGLRAMAYWGGVRGRATEPPRVGGQGRGPGD